MLTEMMLVHRVHSDVCSALVTVNQLRFLYFSALDPVLKMLPLSVDFDLFMLIVLVLLSVSISLSPLNSPFSISLFLRMSVFQKGECCTTKSGEQKTSFS